MNATARLMTARTARLWRTISFAVVLLVMGAAIIYLRANTPFLAVASNSMQPTFSRGDLVLVQEKSAYEFAEGDVVVFDVPADLRSKYNYPPTVAHRVTRVTASSAGIAFRTKGDASGEDPFSVSPAQVRGDVSNHVPYVGYLVLFLQSKQGLTFVAAAAGILLVYGLTDSIARRGTNLKRGISSALASEFIVHVGELERRQEQTSEAVNGALGQFAAAMGEYAQHLRSHTAAVQGLASAAEKLDSAVESQILVSAARTTGVVGRRSAAPGERGWDAGTQAEDWSASVARAVVPTRRTQWDVGLSVDDWVSGEN